MQPDGDTSRNIAESAAQAIDFYYSGRDAFDQVVRNHLDLNTFLIHYVATMRQCAPADVSARLRSSSYAASTRGNDRPFMVPARPLVLALDVFDGAPDAMEADGHRLFGAARELNVLLLSIVASALGVTSPAVVPVISEDINRITKEDS